jgi:hypothetical protein
VLIGSEQSLPITRFAAFVFPPVVRKKERSKQIIACEKKRHKWW